MGEPAFFYSDLVSGCEVAVLNVNWYRYWLAVSKNRWPWLHSQLWPKTTGLCLCPSTPLHVCQQAPHAVIIWSIFSLDWKIPNSVWFRWSRWLPERLCICVLVTAYVDRCIRFEFRIDYSYLLPFSRAQWKRGWNAGVSGKEWTTLQVIYALTLWLCLFSGCKRVFLVCPKWVENAKIKAMDPRMMEMGSKYSVVLKSIFDILIDLV